MTIRDNAPISKYDAMFGFSGFEIKMFDGQTGISTKRPT